MDGSGLGCSPRFSEAVGFGAGWWAGGGERTTTPGTHCGRRAAAPAQWGRPGRLGIDYSIVWDASVPACERGGGVRARRSRRRRRRWARRRRRRRRRQGASECPG